MLGMPAHHHLPDQRRGLQYPATPPGKDDGGPPGQTCTMPGGYSGGEASRREQCNEFSRRTRLTLGLPYTSSLFRVFARAGA
jgi:hypothetical protein